MLSIAARFPRNSNITRAIYYLQPKHSGLCTILRKNTGIGEARSVQIHFRTYNYTYYVVALCSKFLFHKILASISQLKNFHLHFLLHQDQREISWVLPRFFFGSCIYFLQ